MMKLGGTNLGITDDNSTVCTNGDSRVLDQIKQNAQRPDGYTEDFVPHVQQMSRGHRAEAGILD